MTSPEIEVKQLLGVLHQVSARVGELLEINQEITDYLADYEMGMSDEAIDSLLKLQIGVLKRTEAPLSMAAHAANSLRREIEDI